MHPAVRIGLAIALACALTLGASLALHGDLTPDVPALREQVLSSLLRSGALLSAFLADAWGWLLERDVLPDAASPGLLLVAGGMLALLALTVALLLRGAFPAEPAPALLPPRRALVAGGPSPARPAPAAYRGPRDQEFQRGRVAGARIEAHALDDLLDYMVEAEVGQPRILRSIPNLMRLRLHECRGCGGASHDASGAGEEGCAFECGFLESSLSKLLRNEVIVHEVACRGRGATTCDFEVWY